MEPRNTKVVPVKLDDETEFLMEVSEVPPPPGERQQVSAADVFHAADLTKSVTAISKMFVTALKETSPDKFSVEFGVEASLKAGKLLALLCSGEGKANLKITLEWAKEKAEGKTE